MTINHIEEKLDWQSEMIFRHSTIEQEDGACGIPEAVRACMPTGDKILVLVEAPPELTEGGLIKPQQVIAREMGGSGWIIALGPEAGTVVGEAAAQLLGRDVLRSELVGAKVVWGRYGGEALVVTDREDEFQSRFRIIKEEHIMCILSTLAEPE